MNKNIVIIHYNTPYLIECLVESINLFVNDAIIYIFDNSSKFPFTKKIGNVTILDNTKGNIINFDKWLEKYPNRKLSSGKVNGWGSAKHCYSVEKCIEIIGENFILLDSDILLKKDISNLYKNDIIYAGETITQPNSNIKRILPFMCFINVEMCKKNGVHYFDDNYMHGLFNTKKNRKADLYDTGAGFYINANKFPHEDIKVSDYALHYGNGSWDKGKLLNKKYEHKYTSEMWLMLNKKYWSMEKNKKVVYTCVTGNYEPIRDPSFISNDFDYVLFTDHPELLKSNIWQIKKIPSEFDGYDNVRKQRLVKILTHKLLPEYDLSIWVDASVLVKGDMNEFIKSIIDEEHCILSPQHPERQCIYDEANAVIRIKKDITDKPKKQIEFYKKEGFPSKYGLTQTNIIVRKHMEADCIRLMELWAEQIKNFSHRDQLSLSYCEWKTGVEVKKIDKKTCESKWFSWDKFHGKKKQKNSSWKMQNWP